MRYPVFAIGLIAATSPIAWGDCNRADLAAPYGVLDLADVNGFIAGFVDQHANADFNCDGLFDLNDIGLFIQGFAGGCGTQLPVFPACFPLDADAYYPFEGDAVDASGNGLDGTIVGGVSFAAGAHGLGVLFNGSTGSVRLGNHELLQVLPPFSFSAWVRRDSVGSTDDVFGRGCGGSILWFSAGTMRLNFGRQCGGMMVSLEPVNAAEFSHLVVTNDGDVGRIYIRGTASAESSLHQQLPSENDIWLGGDPSRPVSELFHGVIDEVMFFNRVLTPHEVSALAEEP